MKSAYAYLDVESLEDAERPILIVTEKNYFEKHGHLDDYTVDAVPLGNLLPEYAGELAESFFELWFDGIEDIQETELKSKLIDDCKPELELIFDDERFDAMVS